MTMKTLLSLAAILTITAVALVAADVDGTWKATMQGRDNQTMEMTYKFKAEGDKLTGSISGGMGGGQETAIQDGAVKGDEISFKIKREFNGNAMVMSYKGKLSGDEIKFTQTVEGADRPPREFVAKRAK